MHIIFNAFFLYLKRTLFISESTEPLSNPFLSRYSVDNQMSMTLVPTYTTHLL